MVTAGAHKTGTMHNSTHGTYGEKQNVCYGCGAVGQVKRVGQQPEKLQAHAHSKRPLIVVPVAKTVVIAGQRECIAKPGSRLRTASGETKKPITWISRHRAEFNTTGSRGSRDCEASPTNDPMRWPAPSTSDRERGLSGNCLQTISDVEIEKIQPWLPSKTLFYGSSENAHTLSRFCMHSESRGDC
jgi:hypothetical protein